MCYQELDTNETFLTSSLLLNPKTTSLLLCRASTSAMSSYAYAKIGSLNSRISQSKVATTGVRSASATN